MDLEEGILELEAAILGAAGQIEEDVNVDLKALAAQILGQMIQGNFRNQSGALRQSMFASVEQDNTLRIGMLYYGYFLSFGVAPRRAEGLPVEVANEFGVSEGYRFSRKDKNKGIDARGFYPTDVYARFEDIINNVIQKVEL